MKPKLTETQKADVVRRVGDGETLAALAAEYGVSQSHVWHIKNAALTAADPAAARGASYAQTDSRFTYHWEPEQRETPPPNAMPGLTKERLMGRR